MASACRVSEIHALSADSSNLQFREDGSVHLLTRPGFVAKNRIPSAGNQSVILLPLPQTDREERKHDPVRALKIYLDRTKESRQDQVRLFLPIKAGKKDICSQTVATWLKTVIKEAYIYAGENVLNLERPVSAHEIRAVSASLAFERNVASKDIFQAIGWRSDSTFGRFYLRDLSCQRQAIDDFGPLAAAQNVCNPQSDTFFR